MQLNLFECDNCHWSTFSFTDLRRVLGAEVYYHGDGRRIVVCQNCIELMNSAMKYKPFEVKQELDG